MLKILPRTVDVTLAPKNKTPQNSKTDAIATAWGSVTDLLATDVANAFATSLAPDNEKGAGYLDD